MDGGSSGASGPTDRDRLRGSRARSAATVLAVGIAVLLFLVGWLAPLENLVDEGRFRAVSRAPTSRLLLVDIDEPSIRALGAWPWSRSTYARIVDALRGLGATDIAFDVDFSSPSAPAGDAAFADALSRAEGAVALAAVKQVAYDGAEGSTLIESRPLPRFAAHGWEASVTVWPDPDGRVRWMSRGDAFHDGTMPTLAALLGDAGETDGRFLVDYGIDAKRLPHVSVRDLLAGGIDPADVRGRKVVVGATAVELDDRFEVPRFGHMAGMEIHALAAESLVQGRALQPVGTSTTLAVALLVLGGMAFAARRLPYKLFIAACLAAAGLVEGGALAVQAVWPLVPATAPLHAGFALLALARVAEEIAERRHRLLASRRSANRLRVMLDRVIADSFAGVVVVDGDGVVRALSEAAAATLGTAAATAPGQAFRAILPPPLADRVAAVLARLGEGGVQPAAAGEVAVDLGDGRTALMDCVTTLSRVPDPGSGADGREHAVCLTFRDVTAEREAQARIATMARTDALSGLANRPVFLAGVEDRRSARGAAVVLVDVDRFKLINDRLGHASGDALIQAVAARVRGLVPPGSLAARLGGDEFALIVERTSRAEVEGLLDELRQALGGSYVLGPYEPPVSVSIGAVLCEGQGVAELMRAADTALGAAKAAGGDCARLYDDTMRASDAEGRQVARDLRTALERGEFEVVYQRQVDARSERIVGVEALVRWKHPERGYVPPGSFIPVAERTGLIEPIGAWVLAEACRDAVAWPVPIKVSVNLSAVQLARANLADLILATLADTGLPAARLDLELTESLLMGHDSPAKETLGRLRSAGVKVSLDDFGTGYSSLNYLNTFAIDKVKIDQSFVRNLAPDRPAAAIIRAVVSLAKDLGLRVNVEGVETTAQMRMVQALGCDEIQGYLHGRPEPARAIHDSLAAQDAEHRAAAA